MTIEAQQPIPRDNTWPEPTPERAVARASAAATVGALQVQFMLGMYTNLYVSFTPVQSRGPGGMMMGGGMMRAMGQAMSGSSWLMLHMMLGWLLLILSVVALIGAAIARRARATVFGGDRPRGDRGGRLRGASFPHNRPRRVLLSHGHRLHPRGRSVFR
jgi:hypothetical protein